MNLNPALRRSSSEERQARLFGGLSLRRRPERKEFPGENAGWTTYGGLGGGLVSRSGYPRKLVDFMGAYGGTEDSVSWVYAAVNLVASELASYPYQILDESGGVVAPIRVPTELKDLLDQPNREMTYFDFAEYRAIDQELVGNSYWLKDEINALGQPLTLMRLRPEFVQIAVNDQGVVIGYIYHIRNIGTPIPYDREEVIHFKRPNPLDEYYGMGTVEAIQRALSSDLAQSDHVIGFFSDGARISGVLTTTTLSEIQFQRFKEQFYAEYAGDANAHKILIAEEGTRFDPISQAPGGSGVVELRDMGKDEILSAFGIHEFLLGGAGQSGVYKMEEAQHIFSRRMVPKAQRDSERITIELTQPGWALDFRVNVTYSEPKSTKVERAGAMLDAGATINEARHEMDLPPYDADWANVPSVPQGTAPFGLMGPGGQPHPENAPVPLPTPELVAAAGLVGLPAAKTPFVLPTLPDGFEMRGEIKITRMAAQDVRDLLSLQADIYAFGIEKFQDSFRTFFVGQRQRVLRRLARFDTNHNASRVNREKVRRYPKKDLTPDHLWHEEENEHIIAAHKEPFTAIVARMAGRDRRAPRDSLFPFDEDDPDIAKVLDALGKLITKVNETTQKRVGAVVLEGLRRGYSITQIAHGVPDENYPGIMGVFDEASEYRTRLIAKTETGRTFNLASLIGYRKRGITKVEVFDGAECGWKHHDDTDRAHGSIRDISQALRYPLAHPNCIRAFAVAADQGK